MDISSFFKFLDEQPLYSPSEFSGVFDLDSLFNERLDYGVELSSARLKLYCTGEHCQSYQFFVMCANSDRLVYPSRSTINRLEYQCCNCNENHKTFYLRVTPPASDQFEQLNNKSLLTIEKVGEYPKFGQRPPKFALELTGRERKHLFDAMKCEREGMGIAAFVYYRRVIEARKSKIFDAFIEVLNSASDNGELIAELEAAKKERQFKDSMSKINKALPESLLIGGHDPLQLLYTVLSKGLHELSDDECLENAQVIRVVLFQLSEKLALVLNERKTIEEAVKKLLVARN